MSKDWDNWDNGTKPHARMISHYLDARSADIHQDIGAAKNQDMRTIAANFTAVCVEEKKRRVRTAADRVEMMKWSRDDSLALAEKCYHVGLIAYNHLFSDDLLVAQEQALHCMTNFLCETLNVPNPYPVPLSQMSFMLRSGRQIKGEEIVAFANDERGDFRDFQHSHTHIPTALEGLYIEKERWKVEEDYLKSNIHNMLRAKYSFNSRKERSDPISQSNIGMIVTDRLAYWLNEAAKADRMERSIVPDDWDKKRILHTADMAFQIGKIASTKIFTYGQFPDKRMQMQEKLPGAVMYRDFTDIIDEYISCEVMPVKAGFVSNIAFRDMHFPLKENPLVSGKESLLMSGAEMLELAERKTRKLPSMRSTEPGINNGNFTGRGM